MIKIVGILFIFVGSCGIGLYESYLVWFRYNNLLAIKRCLICLRGEISYGHTPLPEAFHAIASKSSGVSGEFFGKLSEVLCEREEKTLGELWEKTTQSVFREKLWKQSDYREWIELGQTLGYLDCQMQVDTLNLYLERIQESLRIQGEEKKIKIRLYNLLGLMAGAFVTILIL